MKAVAFTFAAALSTTLIALPVHANTVNISDMEDAEIESAGIFEGGSMFSMVAEELSIEPPVSMTRPRIPDVEDFEMEGFGTFFTEIADPEVVEQVQTVVSAPPVVTAPLPAGLPLSLTALAGLMYLARRRRG